MEFDNAAKVALLSEDDLQESRSELNIKEIWDTDKFTKLSASRSIRLRTSQFLPWILHISVLLIYSTVFSRALHARTNGQTHHGDAYVPYVGEFAAVVFQHNHSKYVGEPRTELDEAWETLLSNSNIRITAEEMSLIPDRSQDAISLPDGGYFASPNVYHNLHCIKRLHHYMYRDHYFPNISKARQAANEYHNHHCLDMLRQSVMCAGDMQLLTMKWTPVSHTPTANFSTPHRCINWAKLDEWAASRRIDRLMEEGYLTHPTLGPAYPGGRGDLIGEIGNFSAN